MARSHPGEQEHQWPHERAGERARPGRAPPARRATVITTTSAATSVYGFLTSFTQGVQPGSKPARPERPGESMTLSDEARNFNWLLNSFVDQTTGADRRSRRVIRRPAHGGLQFARPGFGRAARRHHLGLRQPGTRCIEVLVDFAGLEQIIVAMRRGSCSCRRSPTAAASAWSPPATATSGWWATRRRSLSTTPGQVLSPALVAELKAGVVA